MVSLFDMVSHANGNNSLSVAAADAVDSILSRLSVGADASAATTGRELGCATSGERTGCSDLAWVSALLDEPTMCQQQLRMAQPSPKTCTVNFTTASIAPFTAIALPFSSSGSGVCSHYNAVNPKLQHNKLCEQLSENP